MVNPPLIILFAILIIFIILFIIINMSALNSWAQQRETVIIPSTQDCSVPLDELVPIDTSQNICCYNNGQLTGAYFVETESNGTPLEFSVIPVATYYINVCRQYCTNGYTVNTDGTLQCEGETSTGTQTILANDCVSLIKPEINNLPCKGSALAIAARGLTPYYALNADVNGVIAQCPVIGACPN